jgi:hypothetical protein
VAERRREQRGVPDRNGPDPARLRRVPVADRPAAAVDEQHAGPALRPDIAVIDAVLEARRLPIDRRQLVVEVRGRRPVEVANRTALTPRGSSGRWPSRSGRPTSRMSGIRGAIPSDA